MPKYDVFWKIVILQLLTFFVHAKLIGHAELKKTPAVLLGIDLGYSYITSAYFTAAGPIIASRFESTGLYKEMMLAIVNGTADQFCSNDSDPDPLLEELKFILHQSLAESRQTKGDDIDIGMLFYPEKLSDEGPSKKCWFKIFNALGTVAPYDESVLNMRSAKYKVYTFPPDDCYDDEYGKEIRDALMFDKVFLVMVLELMNSVLKVSLAEFSYIPEPVPSILSTFNVSNVSWPAVDKDGLREQVASMFRDQNVKDVRGVLFSAEHSLTEADEVAILGIIETLDRAVPGLAAKVHDFGQGIEFRNTIGAACNAKQLTIWPATELCTLGTDNWEIIEHDEL